MSLVPQSSGLGLEGTSKFQDLYKKTLEGSVEGCVGVVHTYRHKPSGVEYHVKIINVSDNERAKNKFLPDIKIYNMTKLFDHVILIDNFEECDTFQK